ncbi:hypothetical protein NW752_008976 [Fusarium irregulare]|uniref:Uncharacterized protein n=1 Tax=Fusarium irregulare TaxID=2494466 RepID=A0A9W8PJP5_9HYPO|nr:hypothetical protein NW766_009209 [Fusarium irregulare]KAJ4010848.1 hypothetical protein NW752_008976 [Fusarium irregulare]
MATDHEPVTEKPSGSPSSNPPDESTQNAKEEESQAAAKTRPERTANFKDYMRIFSYATKWDFVAYAAGFFASIGAGIVSVSKTHTMSLPDNRIILDPTVDECGLWYGCPQLNVN